jgi:hypothetical protein
MVATQITNQSDANFGALVCPSTNPDKDKIHSRAAEGVYPLAVAYKHSTQTKYRDAAIKLGNWLVKIQESGGSWCEDWPSTSGWRGTTADQLISLAGAFPIVKQFLTSSETTQWNNAIADAANYVESTFPLGNVNYNALGSAALWEANHVVSSPKSSWLSKANSLMTGSVFNNIITDNLLTGEGKGVDQGYDIAQSIGYMALYGILSNNATVKQKAADVLHAHYQFLYPNGSMDNSWGTRSYKWGYESGTKTAPGAHFSFALLADMDPKFRAAGLQCLNYLRTRAMDSSGRVTYGPHAAGHTSSTPPCNYQTFARAQSIAEAIEYGPNVTASEPYPGQQKGWYKYFSAIKVAVVRTEKLMGTVSAYGEIGQYSRNTVPKGGSVCNLWYEGFGANGFLQTSSATSYSRTEPRHMPEEGSLLTLSPRVETASGTYYTNLYETGGSMSVVKETDNVKVTTTGKLTSSSGSQASISYTIVNRFYDSLIKKEITVSGGAQSLRIVEPIVRDPGTVFKKVNDSTATITPASAPEPWLMRVVGHTVPFSLTIGTDSAKYWCPFPGIECYPLSISYSTPSTAAQIISLTIEGPTNTVNRINGPGARPGAASLTASAAGLRKTVTLTYTVPSNGAVTLALFSPGGHLVKRLIGAEMHAGTYTVVWDGNDGRGNLMPSGMYIAALATPAGQTARKVIVK